MFALGGDGCPIGKHGRACSFMVSFLNVGRKVASNYDSYCFFGPNCDDTSPVVKKYARSLIHLIVDLEKKLTKLRIGSQSLSNWKNC
jgi:hypothetical protein